MIEIQNIAKKEKEYQEDINYIICTDKKCKLFWEQGTPKNPFACEYNCPKDCLFFIICPACKRKMFFNPKITSRLQRIDCKEKYLQFSEEWSCGGCSFTRMSSKWQLVYEEDL